MATRTRQITDEMIEQCLADGHTTSVQWCGGLPLAADDADWDQLAQEKLDSLTVLDVRFVMERCSIAGCSVWEEIEMAMAIAAEPEGLDDRAIVELQS